MGAVGRKSGEAEGAGAWPRGRADVPREPRPDWSEGAATCSRAGSFAGGSDSQCKGPEAGPCLVSSRNSKEAAVTAAQEARVGVAAGAEVRGVEGTEIT